VNQNKPQTLKGFRDFLPGSCRVRNYVKNIFINVFETFGFEPLETPALEYASTLMGKYGDEADKLVYSFKDQGNRQVCLRYDLTVPVSKVLAIYQNQIPLPFKRYQIQPVWRAEKPQKGRYREILQCDIDSFGSTSPTTDAEIIAVIYNILQKLNFKKYSIRINSRAVLAQILPQKELLQTLDKYKKIGKDGVTKEFKQKGLTQAKIDSIFASLQSIKPDQQLQQIFDQIQKLGVPKDAYTFDPTMVRGLDYYTGPIFETYIEEPKIGSITGGGRFDNLVNILGGPDISAVGTTIGLDRIVDCILELNLLPNLPKTTTKIMIANLGQETSLLKLAANLRSQNIPTLLYPDPDRLSKQFKYANNKGIPFVAVLGPDELTQNKITLKNLATGQQKSLTQSDLLAQLA
jgi:histidyl-tRNA synthetase